MKKFRITLILKGQQTSTIIHAPTQAQAVALAKAQYPGATNIYAVEIR
jgi:hypothetical protein